MSAPLLEIHVLQRLYHYSDSRGHRLWRHRQACGGQESNRFVRQTL